MHRTLVHARPSRAMVLKLRSHSVTWKPSLCRWEHRASEAGGSCPGQPNFTRRGCREVSSGSQPRCSVTVFPSRCLLRFLSEPFLACSSFSPLILGLPCHSVAMVAEPFDLSTHRPVGLLSFFPPNTTKLSVDFCQTLLCQTQHDGRTVCSRDEVS